MSWRWVFSLDQCCFVISSDRIEGFIIGFVMHKERIGCLFLGKIENFPEETIDLGCMRGDEHGTVRKRVF